MATSLLIANMALAYTGGRAQISSFNEASKEANNINMFFEPVRLQLLQMANWNFARRTRALAVLKAAPGTPENTASVTSSVWSPEWPPPGFLYEYNMPSDSIRPRYVTPQLPYLQGAFSTPLTPVSGQGGPYIGNDFNPSNIPTSYFEVGNDETTASGMIQVINTNAYQALMTYTIDCPNPSIYDPLFVEAYAAALAAKISYAISGNLILANKLFQYANGQIEQARVMDANTGTQIQDIPTDWLQARGYGVPPFGFLGYIYPYAPLFPVLT